MKMAKEIKCPKCGCNRFFTVFYAVDPEDKLYECAHCKTIFGLGKITKKESKEKLYNSKVSISV